MMRLLDLFCGAGGAAVGYYRAGFTEIVGVDICPQPRYPFQFVRADALHPPLRLADFDAIHASPPCQAYIRSGTVAKARRPRLIEPVRAMLQDSGRPYVIENVPGAPLVAPLVLCGSMFGLAVRRHRLFEAPSVFALVTTCDHSRPITGVYGNAHGKRGAWRGMLASDAATWGTAMGIDWMTPRELTQSIPPAYTEFIGRQLLAGLLRA